MDVIFDENTGEILKEDAGICPCLACKLEEKELMDRLNIEVDGDNLEKAVSRLAVGDAVSIVLDGIVSATGTERIRLETKDQRWIAAVDVNMISALMAVEKPEVESGQVFVSGQDLIHVVDVKGKEALCWVRDGITLEEYGDTFNLDYLARLKRSK